jgi:hypothetical protein
MGDRFEVGDDFMSDVDRTIYGDLDNDGWDDLELEFEEFLFLYNFLQQDDEGRKSFWDHERLDWNRHIAKLRHEGLFAKRYRMPETAFNRLVEVLVPFLPGDVTKSRNRCSHEIYPEIIVAIGLRYLAGGSYEDIREVYGVSVSGFYYCRNRFFKAVMQSEDLKIRLPEGREEWEVVRLKFHSKSEEGIVRGCVGAIDGFFQPTKCPTVKETNGNVRAYFSGHYARYGLNCQALCDSDLRFMFFGVMGPGNKSDQPAYEQTGLEAIIEGLPLGLYIAADAAYIVTEHVLIPFIGSQRQDRTKDAFNFFLSQLRIRIENAFGLLTTKWRILRRPLECSLKTNALILEICARLHNFVIDNKEDDFSDEDWTLDGPIIGAMADSPLGWGYLPTVEELQMHPGTSQTRDAIMRHIRRNGFSRPQRNLEQQKQQIDNDIDEDYELHELGFM